MATSVQEYRDAITSIAMKDEELHSVKVYLDDCLGMPVSEVYTQLSLLDELKKGMQQDVMHFIFKKKDGTIRHAYGTRAQDVLTRNDSLPESNSKKKGSPGTVFPYYDIEKGAWRGFKVESLISIERSYTI